MKKILFSLLILPFILTGCGVPNPSSVTSVPQSTSDVSSPLLPSSRSSDETNNIQDVIDDQKLLKAEDVQLKNGDCKEVMISDTEGKMDCHYDVFVKGEKIATINSGQLDTTENRIKLWWAGGGLYYIAFHMEGLGGYILSKDAGIADLYQYDMKLKTFKRLMGATDNIGNIYIPAGKGRFAGTMGLNFFVYDTKTENKKLYAIDDNLKQIWKRDDFQIVDMIASEDFQKIIFQVGLDPDSSFPLYMYDLASDALSPLGEEQSLVHFDLWKGENVTYRLINPDGSEPVKKTLKAK